MVGIRRNIGHAENRNHRPVDEDSQNSTGWEIVYTGFILILLCFFIMLCSFSSVEGDKVMKFVASFADALSIHSGGTKIRKGEVVLNVSVEMVSKKNEMADLHREITSLAERLGIKEGVNFKISKKGVTLGLADTALFELGKAQLTKESGPILGKIAAIIRELANDVRIEGHTDNLPIHTEQFPSNWELSTTRAVNVLRYFIEKEGIPAERLSAVGFGEYQPIVSNNIPENMAKNRRVEIIFKGPVESGIAPWENGGSQ